MGSCVGHTRLGAFAKWSEPVRRASGGPRWRFGLVCCWTARVARGQEATLRFLGGLRTLILFLARWNHAKLVSGCALVVSQNWGNAADPQNPAQHRKPGRPHGAAEHPVHEPGLRDSGLQ